MTQIGWLVRLNLWLLMVVATVANAQDVLCTGGSVYFTAHPIDSLLYQNPDLFRDLYVFKCITTVVFTTGDRGTPGNFSRSLERGLEHAYEYMIGEYKTGWSETDIQIKGKPILLRYLKEAPQVKILYLRLPDGHDQIDRQSLRKLYRNQIQSITAGGGSTYTLSDLEDVVAEILQDVKAQDIRILDYKTTIATDNEENCDHADHAVSARIVAHVVKRDKVEGRLLSYAAASAHKLEPTLNTTSHEFDVKAEAFSRYAIHDDHMCKNYSVCLASPTDKGDIDVRYAANWMDREYYVQ